MIPKITCRTCGKELDPAECFCSSCGAEIEWQQAVPPGRTAGIRSPITPPSSQAQPACPLCGHVSRIGAGSCESCGAALAQSPTSSAEKPLRERTAQPVKTPP